MTKRLSIVVLAAGALLLSACGTENTAASDSTSDTSTPVKSTSDTSTAASGTSEDLQPVDCGEVTLKSGVHHLVADPAANGIVGCTEAFNVLDEFTKLPPEQQSAASLGNVDLPSGWSCTVDDGETANVSCAKDKVGDEYGFALHTEQQA